MKTDKTMVDIDSFFYKYISVITEDEMLLLNNASMRGEDTAFVENDKIAELQRRLAERERAEREERAVSSYRLLGMEEERNARLLAGREKETAHLRSAFRAYATCIDLGEKSAACPLPYYAHAYERIIVVLHKLKDTEREREYLSRYLAYPQVGEKDREKYSQRLSRMEAGLRKEE